MKGERTVEKRRERNTKKTLLDIYSKYGIILILILIMAFLTIRTGGTFIGKKNLLNILKQIACIGVLACGQTAVIIAGGMDLSVGSIVSLVSVLVASTAHPGDFPLIVPIMVGLLTGLVCGLINGLAVAKLKIPPFIVTMSTMTIFAGIALLITKGTPINHFSDAFNFIGGGKLLGIPAPIFVLLLVVLLSWFLMRKTTLGYHIISVGGNENAAKMAGINTVFTKIVAYSFCGLMSGVGGILLTSRVQSGLANLGDGLQMEAIAAAVIGGTSLSGGKGNVLYTIVGACIIGVINNGMDLLRVNMYWQDIVSGIVIMLAVFLDIQKNRSNQ